MCFGKKANHIQLPPDPPPLTLRDRKWSTAQFVPGQGYNLGPGPRPSVAHQRASIAHPRSSISVPRGSIAGPRGSIAGPAARRASVNPRLGNGASYAPGSGARAGRRASNVPTPLIEPEPAELPPQSPMYDSYDQRRWSTVPPKDPPQSPYGDHNFSSTPSEGGMNGLVPPEGRRDTLVIYGSDKRKTSTRQISLRSLHYFKASAFLHGTKGSLGASVLTYSQQLEKRPLSTC